MLQDVELDLTLDEEVFASPGGGRHDAIVAAGATPDGTGTFTTTCWSCGFTCGECKSYCCLVP